MTGKITDTGRIRSQSSIAFGVYRMEIETQIAALAVPGQFVSVYCRDSLRILPRPISICSIDREESTITLVYRIAGKGTKEFSEYTEGQTLKLLGPVGNGFPIEGSRPILVGGGIGVPPMLELAKAYAAKGICPLIVLGYRNDELFLLDEFKAVGQVFIATDDGSVGTKGTVIDAIRTNGLTGDVIHACGPKPMLRALKAYASDNNTKCYISMEERMACGVGACLGCVCQTADVDEHSQVKNKRVCVDGPVFLSTDIEL